MLILAAAPLVEMTGVPVVYAGMPDVADDAALGSPATPIVVAAVMAVTLVGAMAARRGLSGPAGPIAATALFISAGATAALGVAFGYAARPAGRGVVNETAHRPYR